MAENIIKVKLQAAVKKFQKDMKSAKISLGDVAKQSKTLGKTLSKNVSGPLAIAGGMAIKQSMKFERLKTSLKVLTGSADEGAKAFENLVKFSAKTPFQLDELAQTNNMLMGFGLSTNEALDSLKLLGDIAAVSGGSLNGIAVAYGQAAAEGRLMTRDIMQLVNNGVPAYKLLAEQVGVSTSEIRKMASDGKISFDLLQKSLISATSEGGMFENGMEVLSGTLGGVASTVRDNLSIALSKLGDEIVDAFDLVNLGKKFIGFIQNAVKSFQGLTDTSKRLVVQLAAFSTIAPIFLFLAGTAIPALTTALTFLAANPAVALLGALSAIGVSLYANTKNFNNFKDALKDSTDKVKELKSETKKLQKDATEDNSKAVVKLYEHYIKLAQAEKNRLTILKENGKRTGLSAAALGGFDKKIEEHTKTIHNYSVALGKIDGIKASKEIDETANSMDNSGESAEELAKKLKKLQLEWALISEGKAFQEEFDMTFGLGSMQLEEEAKIDEAFKEAMAFDPNDVPLFDMDDDESLLDNILKDKSINDLRQRMQNAKTLIEGIPNIIEGNVEQALIDFGTMLGNAMLNGGNILEGGAAIILNALGNMAVQVGQLAIGIGVGIEKIKLALGTLAGPVAIAAGVALVALGTFFKGQASQIAGGGGSGSKIPAFANGGIVSGPTLGLMGEYSGAKSNPEVIAPLDKLKGMIGDRSQNINVGGEFRVQGQDLVLALQRADRNRGRIK